MKHIFTKYKLQLIKENSGKYEVNKKIENPKDIDKVAREVIQLDKETEEVLLILALNQKNEIIGMFEVSRGTVNSALVNAREIFKRLFLINAVKFIAVHNHPSQCSIPSQEDVNVFDRLKEAGELLDVELLDFGIIGNELFSFRQENYYE